jgi:hypothetical protein
MCLDRRVSHRSIPQVTQPEYPTKSMDWMGTFSTSTIALFAPPTMRKRDLDCASPGAKAGHPALTTLCPPTDPSAPTARGRT